MADGDSLGVVTGGSPYPVRKRRRCSVEGCDAFVHGARSRKCTAHARTPEGYRRQLERSEASSRARPRRQPQAGAVYQSVTAEEWVTLWRAQSGRCCICEHPLRNRYDAAPQPGARVASLDHDHAVESALKKAGVSHGEALRRSLRGLLCGYPCNRLLVRFWTAERLERASAYSREMPAQAILHGTSTG